MPKNTRSKGKSSRGPQASGRRNGSQSTTHPPQFSASKRFSGRARYLATGSTTAITRGALLSHLIMNTASSTANYRLLTALRLKSVEIWASTATLGSTTTASVEWFSEQGPNIVHSDTSVGTAEPLHVFSRPPSSSLAGYWSTTAVDESVALCQLVVPANGIVDITYDAVIQDGTGTTAVTTTNSGTVGQVYMTYLAGATTTTFQPVSYLSLT